MQKKWGIEILFVFLILGTHYQCDKSSVSLIPVKPPGKSDNVLMNSSFEKDGQPTLEGWRIGNPQLVRFVHQAPPEGGEWCIELTSDWSPTTGFIYTPVPEIQDGDVVQLSGYIRSPGSAGGGYIALAIGKNHFGIRKVASVEDTVWTEVTLMDTVSLSEGDTLWVVVSSFNTEIVSLKGLFDEIRLFKLARSTGE